MYIVRVQASIYKNEYLYLCVQPQVWAAFSGGEFVHLSDLHQVVRFGSLFVVSTIQKLKIGFYLHEKCSIPLIMDRGL